MARSNRQPVPLRFPPWLSLVTVAVLLYVAREVLIPIAMAVLVTFVLTPSVRRLERARVPRFAAVLALVMGATALLAALGWIVENQVYDLATHLPEYRENIASKLAALRHSGENALGRAGTTISELGREALSPPSAAGHGSSPAAPEPAPVRVVADPTSPLTYARALLGPVFGPLATAGIVVVFSIFMLNRREDLRNRVVRIIGRREMHVTVPALDEAAQRITRYLTIQLVMNATVGVVIGTGLFLLGVPGAAVWGLLIALLRFAPYVGMWVAAGLPLAVSIAVSPGWVQPASALALIVAVELTVANMIEPVVFGSGTGLSPLAVLTAAVFWAWLWGPVGLLLATPLTVCLAVVGRHVRDFQFLDVLLRDAPGLTPDAQFYQRLLAGDQHEAGQIVERFAKDKPLVEIFDGLVLPAMRLAEADRHRGDLDVDTDTAIREMVEAVVEDIGGRRGAPESPAEPRAGAVLCIPARDWADEFAAGLLARLLGARDIRADVLSAESLTGELVAQVGALSPSAVCVSAVPPAAAVHIRVLCKRLRAKFPDLPIVAGLWDGRTDAQSVRLGLGEIGTDLVATSLGEAVEQLARLSAEARSRADAPLTAPNQTGAPPAADPKSA